MSAGQGSSSTPSTVRFDQLMSNTSAGNGSRPICSWTLFWNSQLNSWRAATSISIPVHPNAQRVLLADAVGGAVTELSELGQMWWPHIHVHCDPNLPQRPSDGLTTGESQTLVLLPVQHACVWRCPLPLPHSSSLSLSLSIYIYIYIYIYITLSLSLAGSLAGWLSLSPT
eukprot:COSAG05_NODE_101_length_19100_cov_24.260144_4_plen_170_part_00